MRRTIGIICAIFGIWGTTGFAEDLSLEEVEVDQALTFEFPTPHTDWAQPYAQGKTRVLFLTSGMDTHARECVEIMQRFDLDAESAFWGSDSDTGDINKFCWHGGKTGERRLSNLLERKWDCYVFMGLPLTTMSAEQQYTLLTAVKEGAGLVLVGVNDERVLKEKNRIRELPPLLASGPVGDAYTVGAGRGVRLPATPARGYYVGCEVDYDYWAERMGRTVLWAAAREPKARLELNLPQSTLAYADELRTLKVTLAGTLVGAKPLLQLSFRRPGDLPVNLPPKAIAADTVLEFAIPRLAAGDYHADARVVGSKGVETWATVPFKITSARTVAEVKLSQPSGEIGERLAGQVVLQGPAGKDETIRVMLLDRRRRELLFQDLKPASGQTAFVFEIRPWLPMLVTVEARLLEGKDEVARAYQYFHVTKRNRGQFNFLMWDGKGGPLASYAEESLARNAMTLQLWGFMQNPPPVMAAFEVACVPYTTRLLVSKTPEGLMQPFCWNDAAAVQKQVTELAQKYLPARRHGTFVYSLGDENETLGCCLCPNCAKAYRQFLQETYGGLEALNASWGTAFKTWEEVGLSQKGDNEEANSRATKNYARWFDRQAFKSWTYVQYCRQYAKAYAAMDPQAKTGFEGAGSFAGGDDLDLIVRSVDFWSPYPGTADEVTRSIAPREMPRSNWMGYTKDADSLLAKYWRMVTRGMDSVWWWRCDGIGVWRGWLAPDLRPFPAVKDILADTQIVREGLGDLLLKSEMLDDGVAMLYSYPSTFATQVEEGPSFGGYEKAHLGAQAMVRGLGLPFRYVTDGMLRRGEFAADRYKVLLLIRAEALGDKEATVIREFVKNGGTVIADFRPGLYDERCKPRAKGVLDDLFGIERVGKTGSKTAPVSLEAGTLDRCLVDPGIRVTDGIAQGKAEDGTPVVIVRKTGKGQAVLLNFSKSMAVQPEEWIKSAVVSADAQLLALQRSLFAEAGVTPAVVVKDEAGNPIPGLEIVRWRNGSTEIMALFAAAGEKHNATVELKGEEPRFVYDLRHRKTLGRTTRFRTEILPARASFFAVCTKKVPRPELILDQTKVERGTVVKVSLAVPQAEGLQAFRIRVKVGEQELDWLDRNIIAGKEAQSFEIPVAYNDPAGKYMISVQDLFTQKTAQAVLSVR